MNDDTTKNLQIRAKDVADKTLYETFLECARMDYDAPALLYKGKNITYRAFLRSVDTLAAALIQAGVMENDVVSVALPNLPKAAALLYAVNKIGAIAYFQHVLDTPCQVEASMKKTNSKILFTVETNIAMYADFCKKNGFLLVSCCPADELGPFVRTIYRRREGITNELRQRAVDFHAFIKNAVSKSSDVKRRESGLTAVLLNSGGTTGISKTVELPAGAINALCVLIVPALNVDTLSRKYLMSPLPIFHSFGLTIGLHMTMINGACSVFMPRFSRKDAIRYLKRKKIHFMIGVPAVYEALLTMKKFNGKKLRGILAAFVGGDACSMAVKAEFDRRLADAGSVSKLYEGYGLSETMSVVCVNTQLEQREGSVGKPVAGIDIRAVQTPEAEAFLQDGEVSLNIPKNAQVGELCIASDVLMNGYYHDSLMTEATFFTDDKGARWLKSGDFGYIDQDGFIFYLARLKNIIKVSGESIFPIEVETLASKIPGVMLCTAFGVPDTKTGSRVYLAVEPEKGADREKLREEIMSRLTEALQKNALPKGIDFFDRLPRTNMQKIDVVKLRELCGKV